MTACESGQQFTLNENSFKGKLSAHQRDGIEADKNKWRYTNKLKARSTETVELLFDKSSEKGQAMA
jgi:hypothetical protein